MAPINPQNQPKNHPQRLRPEALTRQITQLKLQIEQGLSQHLYGGLDVRCNYPIAGRISALTVLSQLTLSAADSIDGSVITVPWSLDIADGCLADSAEQQDIQRQDAQAQNAQQQGARRLFALQQQAQAYAQAGVAECWLLDITTVELRIYRDMSATGYRQRLLVHEGATVSPLAFPQLRLTVQEPLPLFFLTRTTTGQKTYPTTMLPLHMGSFQSP